MWRVFDTDKIYAAPVTPAQLIAVSNFELAEKYQARIAEIIHQLELLPRSGLPIPEEIV